MKASLFYLPSIGSRAEIEAGMAGMNPHFYQRMLKELTEQIKLGDELGYDSVSFTEHHFHIEGFELSNSASCCRPATRSASPKTSPCSTI
jgi:alkanesulfonate monooxygenase SsuD/methylene tetrahydromethanopterin reductase-like flavin-dependent oxidoreductase (luciferase family)